jgi:alpha-beta hydrolase superfamily lysophospholipase
MKKAKKRKIFKRIFFVLTISGLLFLHFYVPRFITEIKNPLIQLIKGNYLITAVPIFENNELNGKYINFNSFDDAKLSSYLTYSSLDSIKGTIILLHGIRSNKESFIVLSNKLSKLGFNSVALDSRAHGQSGGTHCTFGVKEKKDVSELISVLSEKEGITKNIGVWGQSLGGAIGLQALGNDKRIKFGIIESTFSDFKIITNDYFNYHAGFNIRPLTNYLVYRAGQIAEFDPNEAKPIKYCENIEQPILIVHGNKDERINIQYGKDNFSKIPSTKKEFIEIKNANHLNVWKTGGDEYFERIIKFIKENTVGNTVYN